MREGDPEFRPCLVLPTFNNAGTLGGVLERALALGLPTYVVNDGCTDGTGEVLAAFRGRERLRVLMHDANQGKAAAMRTGFNAAIADGCTHAVTIDTDGQLDPEQSPLLLEAARRSPRALVLGVRDQRIERCPRRSRVGRWWANAFIYIECGVRVTDSQCGLRVYPLEFVRRVPVKSGRFGYETEVITLACWCGYGVVQVPVSCRYFEQRVTHFRPWVDTWRAVALHARLLGSAIFARPGRIVDQEAAPAGTPVGMRE
ncbi:MAG TPA: glycosyltransferase family 2 protein [Phycisphaerales bacterium]|nr:glycosyltransferase family 2 protein [Phycisphaerales bacterium]